MDPLENQLILRWCSRALPTTARHGRKPIEIDAHPGLPRDDNGAAEGFAGVIGPDGKLYAIWSQDDAIMFTTSRDGGKTFSHARAVIHTAPIMFAIQTLERANGFPQIAIDPKGKRLYVTWSDYRNGDLDVFLATSDDGGKHWTTPVRVNNDPVHNGAEQFFQWLAVDPTDGSINVIFYDRRGDPQNRKQIVVLARSTDGGRTFNNYAWTDQPFEASDVFFGDYSGIAAYGGTRLRYLDGEACTRSRSKGKGQASGGQGREGD